MYGCISTSLGVLLCPPRSRARLPEKGSEIELIMVGYTINNPINLLFYNDYESFFPKIDPSIFAIHPD
jgi:hypothetical protein